MADFTIKNGKKPGKEINFDLSKMTYNQFKDMFNPKSSEETSDETLCRVAGISPQELGSLSFPEYQRLFQAFLKKTREPLSDPNA
jgi:hypothetical protein